MVLLSKQTINYKIPILSAVRFANIDNLRHKSSARVLYSLQYLLVRNEKIKLRINYKY